MVRNQSHGCLIGIMSSLFLGSWKRGHRVCFEHSHNLACFPAPCTLFWNSGIAPEFMAELQILDHVDEHALSLATKFNKDIRVIPAPLTAFPRLTDATPLSAPLLARFIIFYNIFTFSTPPRISTVIAFSARSPVRQCANARPFVTLLYLDARIRSRTAFAAFDSFYSTFTSHLCSRTFPPFYAICLHTFYIQIMVHKLAIKTQ